MLAQSSGPAARSQARTLRSSRSAAPVAAMCVGAAMLGAPALAHALWGAAAPWGPTAAMAATAVAGAAMLIGLVRTYPHDRFGLCNALTLGRAMLTAVLAVVALAPDMLGDPRTGWLAVGLALSALALDGLDGLAARRAGLVSAFGARFDMEVDTALALALAVLVALSGKVGVWVLALGLMRPAFVIAGLALPRLRRPLPPAQWRKVICVVQIGTLTGLLAPVVVAPMAPLLAGLALVLLSAGFARDVVWLWRRP